MSRSPEELITAANDSLLVDGDLDAIPLFFAADYVVHYGGTEPASGHTPIRRAIESLRRSFSDLTVHVEILLVGEDRIAWQRTFHGVHTGSYAGFPATGRSIVWHDMLTSRFRDERIAEEWMVSDLAERLLLARKS